eukprot:6463119-Prymnesium_polylepis.1
MRSPVWDVFPERGTHIGISSPLLTVTVIAVRSGRRLNSWGYLHQYAGRMKLRSVLTVSATCRLGRLQY